VVIEVISAADIVLEAAAGKSSMVIAISRTGVSGVPDELDVEPTVAGRVAKNSQTTSAANNRIEFSS
jgi:hypothetical protein